MTYFTCTYCQQPIKGLTIILDDTHFVHQGCKEAMKVKLDNEKSVANWKAAEEPEIDGKRDTKTLREEIIKNWEASGYLDGLSGHVDNKLAQLFESETSSEIPKE